MLNRLPTRTASAAVAATAAHATVALRARAESAKDAAKAADKKVTPPKDAKDLAAANERLQAKIHNKEAAKFEDIRRAIATATEDDITTNPLLRAASAVSETLGTAAKAVKHAFDDAGDRAAGVGHVSKQRARVDEKVELAYTEFPPPPAHSSGKSAAARIAAHERGAAAARAAPLPEEEKIPVRKLSSSDIFASGTKEAPAAKLRAENAAAPQPPLMKERHHTAAAAAAKREKPVDLKTAVTRKMDELADKAGATARNAQAKAVDAKDTAAAKVESAKAALGRNIDKAGAAIAHKAQEAKEALKGTARTAEKKLSNAKHTVNAKTRDAGDSAKATARKAEAKAANAKDAAADKLKTAKTTLARKVDDAKTAIKETARDASVKLGLAKDGAKLTARKKKSTGRVQGVARSSAMKKSAAAKKTFKRATSVSPLKKTAAKNKLARSGSIRRSTLAGKLDKFRLDEVGSVSPTKKVKGRVHRTAGLGKADATKRTTMHGITKKKLSATTTHKKVAAPKAATSKSKVTSAGVKRTHADAIDESSHVADDINRYTATHPPYSLLEEIQSHRHARNISARGAGATKEATGKANTAKMTGGAAAALHRKKSSSNAEDSIETKKAAAADLHFGDKSGTPPAKGHPDLIAPAATKRGKARAAAPEAQAHDASWAAAHSARVRESLPAAAKGGPHKTRKSFAATSDGRIVASEAAEKKIMRDDLHFQVGGGYGAGAMEATGWNATGDSTSRTSGASTGGGTHHAKSASAGGGAGGHHATSNVWKSRMGGGLNRSVRIGKKDYPLWQVAALATIAALVLWRVSKNTRAARQRRAIEESRAAITAALEASLAIQEARRLVLAEEYQHREALRHRFNDALLADTVRLNVNRTLRQQQQQQQAAPLPALLMVPAAATFRPTFAAEHLGGAAVAALETDRKVNEEALAHLGGAAVAAEAADIEARNFAPSDNDVAVHALQLRRQELQKELEEELAA